MGFDDIQELGSDELDLEEKVFIAEEYLDRYNPGDPRDIYRWLWEGEFGPGSHVRDNTLEQLAQDIRRARMHPNRDQLPVCENLGLAHVFVKVNLVPFADTGCPLKRLVMIEERIKDLRPDPLRFKKDWAFMKTQLVPGMRIQQETMNRFEQEIPFHMAPEVEYSNEFYEKFGMGYRIVPRNGFFQYFPEYILEVGGARTTPYNWDTDSAVHHSTDG